MKTRRTPRLSLDLLRGFCAAARHLSFTSAAQELSVTQSAISHEVKALEEQLGAALFTRTNRAIQLTPAGKELHRVTEEALRQIDAAIERIAGFRRTLGVTTTPALASLWLAPRLARFNRDHPGVDVRVVASNDRPDLKRDGLDIAIRFVTAGADQPNGSDRLLDCRSFPVCAPDLVNGGSNPIRVPDDLQHHVRLDYESLRDGERFSEWDFWFDAMKMPRVDPASTLWFPQYDQLVSAAIEGNGIAMGVLPHVAHHLRQGTLCAPFGTGRMAQRGEFFLVRRPDVAEKGAMDSFISWLVGEAQLEDEFIGRKPDRAEGSPAQRE